MTSLCEFFPGADTPINYDDCEDDDSCSIDEPQMYDSADNTQISTTTSRRPASLVETRINELQQLLEPKPNDINNRIRRFNNNKTETGDSPIIINRTSSSPDRLNAQMSEASTPQDSLRNLRSPVVFSENSSPRRLSPIAYRNVGNINPRHIDMEQYWNKENEKSEASTPSMNSNTNSAFTDGKGDYNQNYCNRISNANSPVDNFKGYYNGNGPQELRYDPRYQTPLQIVVDPVSIFRTTYESFVEF